jgi:hypothetical protein
VTIQFLLCDSPKACHHRCSMRQWPLNVQPGHPAVLSANVSQLYEGRLNRKN